MIDGNVYCDRFPVSTTEGIPQPWTNAGMPQDAYMALAEQKETLGLRLVVETIVNGYPDPLCEGDLWILDWLDYTDWRTGEHIWGYDPEYTEVTGQTDGFFIVERRLAEVN